MNLWGHKYLAIAHLTEQAVRIKIAYQEESVFNRDSYS